ncbi:YesL family protein [Metabacillus herbersteinensis]|uniref:YesL family protein n=1 Tax=Metabacillus herbersteinensis TaxID=283816 RepID=A0ABV6GI11_9BACI
MQTTSIFDGIFKLLEWFTRFSLANLLWVFFNLPISFLVATISFTDDKAFIMSTWFIIALLAPFVFFPATTAMYAVIRKWIMGEPDISIIRYYWKYYRENYKKSLIGGAILVPIWVIGIVDVYFLFNKSLFFSIVFIIVLLFLFILTTYFFAVIVHNDVKIKKAFKQAFLFMFINPFNSFFIGLLNLVILYFCLMKFTFLIPFVMGSGITCLAFWSYYRKHIKVQQLKS